MEHFSKSSHLPVSCEEAFLWHTRPGALERMLPPWMPTRIISSTGGIQNGSLIHVQTNVGPVKFNFKVVHEKYTENVQFADTQIQGPFRSWHHIHRFESHGREKSKITDEIAYELPLKFFTSWMARAFVEKKLEHMFTFRHRTLINDLYLHSKYSKQKLKILVTGSNGFVGKELVHFLTSGGHTVLTLQRKKTTSAEPKSFETQNGTNVYWNESNKSIDNPLAAEDLDGVVHLSGENIAAKKWTEERKQVLLESRVQFTKNLCHALLQLKNPPKAFICASGIGYFGARQSEEICHEDSHPGEGFLAELAQQWEQASNSLKKTNIRVVHLRFGSILSSGGGVLQKMILPYKLFLGGPFGSGKQMMPWISMTDVLGLVMFILATPQASGPFNAVAPNGLMNKEFSSKLSEILNTSSFVKVPEFCVETLFGQMGTELLLSGVNAKPTKALKLGYEFIHSDAIDALSHTLEPN